MRTTRPLCLLLAALPLLSSVGCGGGGGRARAPLFPAAVTAADLVAVAFTQEGTFLSRLTLADVKGRGEASVDDLVLVEGGFIDDLAWSPDHTRLAVLAQPDAVVGDLLYVVEPLTGAVTTVSGPQAADTTVEGFQWSPDSSRLAFVRNRSDGSRLFVVRPDGTGRIDLTEGAVTGGGVSNFEWSPDSTRLTILGDLDVNGATRLYVADRDGVALVEVSGGIVGGGGIFDHRWSPDSSRIALRGDLVTDSVVELFTVLPDGTGSRVRMHPTLVAGGGVQRFEWAPDGSRIAYVADQVTDEVYELFKTQPDGTGNVRLSGTLVTGGDVDAAFVWAPDSGRIAFAADRQTDEVRELFTAPADGGAAAVRVSGPLIATGDVGGDAAFRSDQVVWAPDSSRLAYVADAEVNSAESVYVTLPTSASAVRISPVPSGSAFVANLSWAPDGSKVLFNLSGPDGGSFLSPPAGPAQPISPSTPGFFSPRGRPFTPAGDRVVGEFLATGALVPDIRAFEVLTVDETLVSSPDARPFTSVDLE